MKKKFDDLKTLTKRKGCLIDPIFNREQVFHKIISIVVVKSGVISNQ